MGKLKYQKEKRGHNELNRNYKLENTVSYFSKASPGLPFCHTELACEQRLRKRNIPIQITENKQNIEFMGHKGPPGRWKRWSLLVTKVQRGKRSSTGLWRMSEELNSGMFPVGGKYLKLKKHKKTHDKHMTSKDKERSKDEPEGNHVPPTWKRTWKTVASRALVWSHTDQRRKWDRMLLTLEEKGH